MKLSQEDMLGLSQEADILLARGLNYTEIVDTLAQQGFDKGSIEEIVANRISLRAAHQPFLLKKDENRPRLKHEFVGQSAPPKMTIWEFLGGFGSGIVLLLLAVVAGFWGFLTGDVTAIATTLGLLTVAILNMMSDYRGMW